MKHMVESTKTEPATRQRQTIKKTVPLAAGNGHGTADNQLFRDSREALRRDINDHGIFRVPEGSHELVSLEGGKGFWDKSFYSWQFYLRGPLLKPEHLTFIARCFWTVFKPRYLQQPFQISGVEQASMPIITAILLTAKSVGIDLHAFTVRKERKAFGLENYIEGTPNTQLPAVFIDDLTSPTHATLWHWIRIVTQARLRFYPRSFVVIYQGQRAELKDIPTSRGNLGIDAIYTIEDFDMTWQHYHGNKFKTGPNA